MEVLSKEILLKIQFTYSVGNECIVVFDLIADLKTWCQSFIVYLLLEYTTQSSIVVDSFVDWRWNYIVWEIEA